MINKGLKFIFIDESGVRDLVEDDEGCRMNLISTFDNVKGIAFEVDIEAVHIEIRVDLS